MNTYHIDLGNSTSGAVGAVLCLKADTPEAALEAAQEKLGDFHQGHDVPVEDTEYFRLYVNVSALTLADVSEG